MPADLRVRIHEAGHAVVAARLGFQIATVSTVADGRSAGRIVLSQHPAGNKSTIAFWSKAIVLAAGTEAEWFILRTADRQGSVADREELARICRHLESAGHSRLDSHDLQRKARGAARQLVHRHAGRIVHVAHRLAEASHMTGTELARLGAVPAATGQPC